MTALLKLPLTLIHHIFLLMILTYLHFVQVGKPVLDSTSDNIPEAWQERLV